MTEQNIDVVSIKKPAKRKKITRNKKNSEPNCWELCKECLSPSCKDDTIHICLGNVFVSRSELERMMNSEVSISGSGDKPHA